MVEGRVPLPPGMLTRFFELIYAVFCSDVFCDRVDVVLRLIEFAMIYLGVGCRVEEPRLGDEAFVMESHVTKVSKIELGPNVDPLAQSVTVSDLFVPKESSMILRVV